MTFSIDPWIPLVFPYYSVLKLIKTFSIEVCLLQSNTRVLCTWSSIDIFRPWSFPERGTDSEILNDTDAPSQRILLPEGKSSRV